MDGKDYVTVDGTGSDTAIVTYGRLFGEAVRAKDMLGKDNINVDIIKLMKIWPLNEGCIADALKYRNLLFVEEGMVSGGIGEHFETKLRQRGFQGNYSIHGIDHFVPHAGIQRTLQTLELDGKGIARKVKQVMSV